MTSVVVVYTFIVGTAAVSFTHIVDVSTTLGLTWEAWTVPFLVDGIVVLGKIGRSSRFAAKTQRAGLVLMAGAGLLSLTCNVTAGDNQGQQLYGVLVVAGFVTTEWYASKLQAAPQAVVEPDEALTAKRRAAALKGAETKRRNKAAATRATRRPRAPKAARVIADLEASYAMADAPVSPAGRATRGSGMGLALPTPPARY